MQSIQAIQNGRDGCQRHCGGKRRTRLIGEDTLALHMMLVSSVLLPSN
jgi:hypothetical protein